MTKEVMTIKEVSEYLKMNYRTIYRVAEKGEIPAFKLGNNGDVSTSLSAEGRKTIRELKLIVIATHKTGDVEFLNSILREDDIIFTYGVKVKLLRRITNLQLMIGRGSGEKVAPLVDMFGIQMQCYQRVSLGEFYRFRWSILPLW